MVVSSVAQRRETKISFIVEAAWSLAREHGIQLVSLRDLAKEVGMQQPSLYVYFDSKNASVRRDVRRRQPAAAGDARRARSVP